MCILQILFYVTFIGAILKLVDLLITEKQKKSLQSYSESFTLLISYANPIIWCRNLLKKRSTQIITTIVFVVCSLFFVINQLDDSGFDQLWVVVYVVLTAIVLLICVVQLLNKKNVSMYTWLLNNGAAPGFIVKFLIITSLIYLYAFLFVDGFDKIEHLKIENIKEHFSPYLIHALLMPAALLSYCFLVLPSIGVFITYLLLLICWVLLKPLEYIMWKIVRYSKGAAAGILIVVTVLIELIKLFLSNYKH